MSETKENHGEGADRGRRRVLIGVVTSDKASKTRRVEIPRQVRHERYGKIIRRRTVCVAHDEKNESHAGDTVEIMESRPLFSNFAVGVCTPSRISHKMCSRSSCFWIM